MAKRSSSLNRTDSGIAREIGTQYANVKIVADNIQAVITAASVDLVELAKTLKEATDFEGISVVSGEVAGWDPVTKVITVPTVQGDKGDTGDSLTMTQVVSVGGGAFRWEFSDGSMFVTPSLTGNKGDKGDKGDTGDAITITSITPTGNGAFIWMFSDGTQYVTPSLKGDTGAKGDKGDKGDDGDALTIVGITTPSDGVFRYEFSDGTIYTTPNLKGPQGVQGLPGVKGDTGVSVHHLKPTNTTEINGDYGKFGELDTYTFYGDPAETNVLGYFSVRNGLAPDQMVSAGYMLRSTYDTDDSGVVDDSERLEGHTLADVLVEAESTVNTAGYMNKSEYDTDDSGSVDNSDRLGGKTLADIMSDVDALELMPKSVYDTDDSGVVDNSERLGGTTLSGVYSNVDNRIAVALEDISSVEIVDTDVEFLASLSTYKAEDLVFVRNYASTGWRLFIITGVSPAVYEELTSARLWNKVDVTTALSTTATTLSTAVNELVAAILTLNSDLEDLDTRKFDKSGGQIGGDVTINGDLHVTGTVTTVHTEELTVTDNIITLNEGETGAGVTKGFAGVVVDRGTEPDYEFVFNENTQTFRIGEEEDTQAVATREDTPLTAGVAYWDSTTSMFKTRTPASLGTDVRNVALTSLVWPGPSTQMVLADGTFSPIPVNVDTVTRLRGTHEGTYQAGDFTLESGANISVTQDGRVITVGLDRILGSAATKDVGTGDGNVMEVGAFGIGKALNYNPDITLEAQHIGGFGSASHGSRVPTDGPDLHIGKVLYVGAPSWGTQLWFSYNEGKAWFRNKESGKPYESWKEFIHSGNTRTSTGNSVTYPMTQKAVTDALNTKANTSTQVIAGPGLSGGGNLTANRTLSVDSTVARYGTGDTAVRTNAQNEDKFVTLDTVQTITGRKTYRGPTLSPLAISSYVAGDTGTSRHLQETISPVDSLSEWPTFSGGSTHVLRLHGVNPEAPGSMMEAWGIGSTRPDIAVEGRQGVVMGNPDGGFKGTGSINAEAIYINGEEVFKDTSGVYTAGPGALSNAVSTMLSADTNNQIRTAIGAAASDGPFAWVDVTGKPAQATRWPTFAEVTGKPSSYPPAEHTHSQYATGDNFNSSGTYPNLRAQGTTPGDIGVRTNSQNDARYLQSSDNGVFKQLPGLEAENLNNRINAGNGVAAMSTQANATLANNFPWASGGGTLLNYAQGSYGTQIYNNRSGSRLAWRAKTNSNGDMGVWREVWHDGNLRFEWNSSTRTLNIVTS